MMQFGALLRRTKELVKPEVEAYLVTRGGQIFHHVYVRRGTYSKYCGLMDVHALCLFQDGFNEEAMRHAS